MCIYVESDKCEDDWLTDWLTDFNGAETFLRSRDFRLRKKKFPLFYGAGSLTSVYKRIRHFFLSWASLIQFMLSQLISYRFILILLSCLRLCLTNGRLPSCFPTKSLYAFLFSPYVPYAPPISWGPRVYFSTLISSLWDPYVFHSTVFSYVSVRGHFSRPYKTAGKIMRFQASAYV